MTDTSASRLLQLLGDITSLFHDGVKDAAANSVKDSESLLFFIELKAEITIFSAQILPLKQRFGRDQGTRAEQHCKSIACQCLQFFENVVLDKSKLGREQLRPEAYPGLENLRRNPTPFTVPYCEDEDQQRHAKQFAQWSHSFSRLGPRVNDGDRIGNQSKRPRPVWIVRDHLKRIHECVRDSWCCTCTPTHEGMMFLAVHRKYRESDSHIKFDFLIGQPVDPKSSSNNWIQSNIAVVDSSDEATTPAVKFSSESQFGPDPPPKGLSDVTSICAVATASRPTSRLNMVTKNSQFSTSRPTPRKLKANIEPSATLFNLLVAPSVLSKDIKIVLAVILSYSILYLHGIDSPWLPDHWDSRAFRFLQSPRCVNFADLFCPLISAGYGSKLPPQSIPKPGEFYRGDPARLALGVLLLEIFRQQPIEKLREKEDFTDEDGEIITMDTNLFTAYRVHEFTDWDVHERYQQAVLACLNDAPDIDGLPWSHLKHATFIYDKVIQPLEIELEAQCNIRVEDLDTEIARAGFDLRRLAAPRYSHPVTVMSRGVNVVLLNESSKASSNLNTSNSLHDCRGNNKSAIAAEILVRPAFHESQKASITESPDARRGKHCTTPEWNVPVYSSSSTEQKQSQNCGQTTPTGIFPSPMTKSAQSVSESSFKQQIEHFLDNVPNSINQQSSKPFLGFQLFDDHVPMGDGTKRADAWFGHLDSMPPPPMSGSPRVKIAILDTGIDMTNTFINLKSNRSRVTYRSFIPGDLSDVSQDLTGHGTHVAGLILKVALNAEIFVARICEEDALEDPKQIAEAIRYATQDWGVDIINMSFGFPRMSEELDCIQTAIEAAHAKKILLFAAAHNSGGLKSIAYPADRQEVICINSTDGEGNPSHFNPSAVKGSNNFSTLGEDVLSSWIGNTQKRKSGTSFATPIAAGIAAFVMDFMMQSSGDWSQMRRHIANRIKSRQGMVTVFQEHLSTKRGDYRFLAPWEFFHEDGGDEIAKVLLNTLRRA